MVNGVIFLTIFGACVDILFIAKLKIFILIGWSHKFPDYVNYQAWGEQVFNGHFQLRSQLS